MLGIRLKPEEEVMLARHAKTLGRQKSVVAREWIMERLERESIDLEMRRAVEVIEGSEHLDHRDTAGEWLSELDKEDGGFDWGPAGPPMCPSV